MVAGRIRLKRSGFDCDCSPQFDKRGITYDLSRTTGLSVSRTRFIPKFEADDIFTMPLVFTTDPIPLVTDADGVVRVSKIRVIINTVVMAFLEGATAEEIVEQYPSLQLSDVYSAIGYYLQH